MYDTHFPTQFTWGAGLSINTHLLILRKRRCGYSCYPCPALVFPLMTGQNGGDHYDSTACLAICWLVRSGAMQSVSEDCLKGLYSSEYWSVFPPVNFIASPVFSMRAVSLVAVTTFPRGGEPFLNRKKLADASTPVLSHVNYLLPIHGQIMLCINLVLKKSFIRPSERNWSVLSLYREASATGKIKAIAVWPAGPSGTSKSSVHTDGLPVTVREPVA